MKKLLVASALAAALAVPTSANASISLVNVWPEGSVGYPTPANTIWYNFETPPFTPVSTGGEVVQGTTATHAEPLGTANGPPDTNHYYAVGPSLDLNSPICHDVGGLGQSSMAPCGVINLVSHVTGGHFTGGNLDLSFDWGSVDSYNTLDFLDSGMNVLASFTGCDIVVPCDGNQSAAETNPKVIFRFTGADIHNLWGMRLSSTKDAFEIDNIAAVPEPATWAMMLVGFGAAGFAMRRLKKRIDVPQLA